MKTLKVLLVIGFIISNAVSNPSSSSTNNRSLVKYKITYFDRGIIYVESLNDLDINRTENNIPTMTNTNRSLSFPELTEDNNKNSALYHFEFIEEKKGTL